MKVNKKVTDFITLEEGNIGRQAAVVTGALLASSVLGLALTTQVAQAMCSPECPHNNYTPHYESHTNTHSDSYGPHSNGCICMASER